ncbi:sulfotransferase 1C2-like [Babylonia areolata]|uniref:sulfotransferase 1C2-like n=1 Tax=Babylonia areolata TaxID=304850 RepID=UPI003FD68A9A
MSEVKVEDGHGGSWVFHEMEGMLYPAFPLDTLKGVRHLDIRPDDVIVCAFPKSGTHWIWEMVRQLLALKKNQDGEYELGDVPVEEKDVGFLEYTPQEKVVAMSSPRALNTHFYFQHLPPKTEITDLLSTLSRVTLSADATVFVVSTCSKTFHGDGCRVVLVVRDIRDVAVSYYHHHSKLKHLYHYHGQWEHYLPTFLEGKLDYGSWFDYHMSWERGLRQHPELPVLALSYENVHQDSIGALRQLAQFLNVPYSEEALRAVDRVCSFDAMKQTKGSQEVDETGMPIMYRKGKTGDWKTSFTAEQAELLNKVYKTCISDFLALKSSCDVSTPLTPLLSMYEVDEVEKN